MTPWSKVIGKFFDKVEKDKDFFMYNNITLENAMLIAQERSKGYLIESIVYLLLNCTPDIDFKYNEDTEEFFDDLNDTEIDLIANIMFEKYLEKDFSTLKAFQIKLSTKDINVFSPANERKTFLDMFKFVHTTNLNLIKSYADKDRITGKFKRINYSAYDEY